jgi:hypothetical protein
MAVDTTHAPDFRIRPRWARAIFIAGLLLLPVAVLEWPWSFLPLRWQHYGAIADAERVIEKIENFRASSGRLPTRDELIGDLQRAVIPDDHFYEPEGDHYSLIATASFDWMVIYDSRTRAWYRKP